MLDDMPWMLAQTDPAPRQSTPANGGGDANGAATQQQPANGDAETGPATDPPPGGGWEFLIPLVLFMLVIYLLLFLPQRRERKRKEQMLGAMKKGDRVQTIGGILGTVVDLREHEVVVKVDESNNTRLRFAKAAVQTVLDKENSKSGG